MADTNIVINDVLKFNEQTGLTVSSRGEIFEDLSTITKIAFGSDYVIEQGNEWYSFLDLLSGTLADVGGSVQKLYEAVTFTGASGVNLDNVVSFVGITRKPKTSSTVLVKATLDQNSTIERPYMLEAGAITLEDSEGNQWVNSTSLIINKYKVDGETENYVGTAEFSASLVSSENYDNTSIVLQPYNNGTNVDLTKLTGSLPADLSFINEVQSKLGNQEETDAQLRARYKREVYRKSTGTVEGLIAQIQENTNANYVRIIENNTSAIEDGLNPHSIWVITDGKSEYVPNTLDPDYTTFTQVVDYLAEYIEVDSELILVTTDNMYTLPITPGTTPAYKYTSSTYPDDIAIAETILNYKSLGCGTGTKSSAALYDPVTGEGRVRVEITIDSTTYRVLFSRASGLNCYVNLNLNISSALNSDTAFKNSIENQIRTNIKNYVGNLGINNDVLFSGVASAVYSVISDNKYSDFNFDINTLFLGTSNLPISGTRVIINESQYPKIEDSSINITWTSV